MANKKYTLEIVAKGLREAAKGIEQLNAEAAKLEGTTKKNTSTNKEYTKSQHDVTKGNKGTSQSTNNTTKAFSKMAQNMEGTLVPAYASVAANVFALTAAFGALSRAADLQILIDASEELATTSGRNLATVADEMKALTGEAISLKEALTSASLAASAGFSNDTIKELTTVARNASVALGRDMTDSLNRIFKGAIKAEPELLDELGIIVRLDKASRNYAATLGKNVKELTTFEKQTAVVNAVLEEGTKKFSAISDVDVNPYSQLAASFNDVSVSITNFLGGGIAPLVSFLSENLNSLTSVLVIFGASILKTALPALNNFSTRVTETLQGVSGRLDTFKRGLQDFRITLLSNATKKDLENSGKIITDLIKRSEEGFTRLGKAPGAGFKNLTKLTTGSVEQLKKFQQVYRGVVRQLEKGIDAGGFKANDANIRLLNNALAKATVSNAAASVEIQKNSRISVSAFTAIAASATRAGEAILRFGTNVALTMSNTVAAVSQASGAFATLNAIVSQTKAAAAGGGLGGAFRGLTSLASGLTAALFKSIPVIGTVIIAWDILSGIFSTLSDLFFGKDIVKLSESLGEQEDALEDSAKAAKFYKDNLEDLSPTLSNINSQLEIQVNLLTEAFSNLDEVVNDIALQDGFGFFADALDVFGFGDLDTYKDNLKDLSDQLKDIGFDSEVNDLLEDFGKITRLDAEEARRLGSEMRDLTKEFRDAARGAKDSATAFTDSLDALDKGIAEVIEDLPKLSGVEKALVTASDVLTRLDPSNVVKVVDAFQNLSTFTLKELGLENIVTESVNATTSLESLTSQLEDLEKRREKLNSEFGSITNDEEVSKINDQISAVKAGIESTTNVVEDFSDTLISGLQEGIDKYDSLVTAQRDYERAVLNTKVSFSVPTGDPVQDLKERIELLKLEDSLINRINSESQERAATYDDLIAKDKKLLETIQSRYNSLPAEEKTKKAELQLATDRLAVENRLNSNKTSLIQLESKLDADRLKNGQNQLKLAQEIDNELTSLYSSQIKGVKGLSYETGVYQRAYVEAMAKAKMATSDLTEEQARQFGRNKLAIKQIFELTRKAFADAGIGDKDQLAKSADAIIERTREAELELGYLDENNRLLDERIGKEQRLLELQLGRQEGLLQDRLLEVVSEEPANSDQETALLRTEYEIREKLAHLEEIRNANKAEGIANEKLALASAIRRAKIESKAAKSELALGTRATRLEKDKLAIEQEIIKAGLDGVDGVKKLNEELEKTARINREIEFAENLTKAAESMNSLADAFANFNDQVEQSEGVAGLTLLQETMRSIDTPISNFGEGMATVGLAIANYNEQIKENSSEQAKFNAGMSLAMNTLGALAGSFEEGSTASKVFMLAQQGVAIANAAAAVTAAGTEGDVYSAPARVAAMLSLMASVLSAFQIANGAGSAGGSNASSDYKDRIGSQGLLDQKAETTALTDGVEKLLSINTKMYNNTTKLVRSFDRFADTISLLTVQLSTIFEQGSGTLDLGAKLSSGNGQSSLNKLVTESFKAFGDVFTLGIGGDFLADIGSSIFGGSSEINQEIIDSGLEFSASINTVGGQLTTALDTLAFNVIEITETIDGGLFSSDDVNIYLETIFGDIDTSVNNAFNLAFNELANNLVDLGNEVASITSSGGDIISRLTGFNSSATLSLEGLETEEERADAITAFFSKLTDEIAGELFPFLNEFRKAGESLGDTLFRLTANLATVNDAFKITDTDLRNIANVQDVSSNTIDVLATASRDQREAFLQANLDQASALVQGLLAQKDALLAELSTLGDTSNDDLQRRNQIFFELATLQAQFAPANLTKKLITEALAAIPSLDSYIAEFSESASIFIEEAAFAWNEALISEFGSADAFKDAFTVFAESVFSEGDIANNLISAATDSVEQGFADLVALSQELGRNDLANILLDTSLSSEEAARRFYDLAESTNAFAVQTDFATGVIDTRGADLLATLTQLGPAFQVIDENSAALEAVIELTREYIQEIALFGKAGKDLDLLTLAFQYRDAIKEAEETGSSIEALEAAFGLRRLEIVNNYFNEIEDSIKSASKDIFNGIISVSSNLSAWDDLAYSVLRINKLASQLSNITAKNLLTTDLSDYSDFIDEFSNILDGLDLSIANPEDIESQISLVDQLRDEILNKYSVESGLIEEQIDLFGDLSDEIKDFLDDVLLSDVSPLTNFEKLNEATDQFLSNAEGVFSEDTSIAQAASDNLLDSASSLLDVASGFFSIGPEFQAVFSMVTSTLEDIDTGLLSQLQTQDPEQELVDLTQSVVTQLNVLDDVLVELKAANESVFEQDVAAAITTGMAPLIGDIVDKLDSINDGTWTQMLNVLSDLSSVTDGNIGTIETINTGSLTSDVNDVTGAITTVVIDNSALIDAITQLTEVLAISQEDLANLSQLTTEQLEQILAAIEAGNFDSTSTAGVL